MDRSAEEVRKTHTPQFWERAIFGVLILGGYMLAMGTLAYVKIPSENLQLFAQGIGALGTAVGVIVAAIWKNTPAETADRNTIATLADKVSTAAAPPAAGTATIAVAPPATVEVGPAAPPAAEAPAADRELFEDPRKA